MLSPVTYPIGVASACYYIFHRWEPCSPLSLVALLLAPPAVVKLSSIGHTSLPGLYAIHFAIIILLTLVYRLSPFHPLAKYPGPRIAAATKIWITYISYRGKQHIYFQKLHQQYGDIVRTGPNELSMIDPKFVAPMLGTGGMPRGPYYDGRTRGLPVKSLVGLRDPAEHSKRRQRWQRGFTTQALQGYEIIIEKRATLLVESMGKHAGEPIDIVDWNNRYAFDVMIDLTFGGGSEMLRDGDVHRQWHALESAQHDSLIIAHLPWFSEFVMRLPLLNKEIQTFRDMSKARCLERMKQGAMQRDIMFYLSDEEGIEDTPPPLSELLPDSAVAFLAGSDSTATTLSCLCYLLITHPDKYERLREEIDTATSYAFDTAANANMPYLNAAINESLRLFPPVPSGTWRAPAIGSGGYRLGNHFIPEGCSTALHMYTMQRDARNFTSPDSFLPERWLPADSPYSLSRNKGFNHNPTAFIPFSYGPANCLGKQLAYQGMRVVVRLMLERFTMRFADGFDGKGWADEFLDYFIIVKEKLPIVLEARNKI